MPPSKSKPSEIAAEAKKNYIPYIRDHFGDRWPATSYVCFSETLPSKAPPRYESGERMNEMIYHARFGIKNPTPATAANTDISQPFMSAILLILLSNGLLAIHQSRSLCPRTTKDLEVIGKLV